MNLPTARLLSALQAAERHVLDLHADLQPLDLEVAVQLARATGVALERLPALVLDLGVEAFADLETPDNCGRRRLRLDPPSTVTT